MVKDQNKVTNQSGGVMLLMAVVLFCLVVYSLYITMILNNEALTLRKHQTQSIEADNIEADLKSILRDQESCRSSFMGVKMDGKISVIRNQIGAKDGFVDNHDYRDIASGGKEVPYPGTGIKILEMKVTKPTPGWIGAHPPKPNDPTTVEPIFFRITFEKQQTQFVGRRIIERAFPIVAEMDPVKKEVLTCFYDEKENQDPIVNQACRDYLQGTIDTRRLANPSLDKFAACNDINIPGAISTDGSFCFNFVTSDMNKAIDPNKKDCISSWFFDHGGLTPADCFPVGPSAYLSCPARTTLVSYNVVNCGKGCLEANGLCCVTRLK